MSSKEKKFSDIPGSEKYALIRDWIVEKKGQDLVALDLSSQASFAEVLVIVSASSVRQAQGLADDILTRCKEQNLEFLHMEGYHSGQWILLDLNDVIIHIFQPEVRELFNLEGLWAKAPFLEDQRSGASPQ